jgi:hypothetical protein
MLESLTAAFADPFSVWQMVGWCAVPFYLISYQFLNPRHTILIHIPADLLYCVHFFGLSATLPMLISMTTVVRNLIGVYGSKKLMRWGLIGFVAFAWTCTAFLASSFVEVLPAIGATFRALSINYRDDFWRYRFCVGLFQIFYMAVFISIGSYPGIFLITLTLSSNIIGMVKKVRVDRAAAVSGASGH